MNLSNSQIRNLRRLMGAVRITGLPDGSAGWVGTNLLASDLGTYGTVFLKGRLLFDLGQSHPQTGFVLITTEGEVFLGKRPVLQYEVQKLEKLLKKLCPKGENQRLQGVVLDLNLEDIIGRIQWSGYSPPSYCEGATMMSGGDSL